MEDNTKIMLTSTVTGSLSVNIPDLRYKRRWEKQGAKKPIDWAVLKEAIYDTGFEYMIKQGMLTIDNEEARIELGLEDPKTHETEIKVLTEAQMKRMATVMPVNDFKTEIAKLPYEQVMNLTDYMIANDYADVAKAAVLKKAVEIDIIKAIQLKHQNKED